MNIQEKYRQWAIEVKHWDAPPVVHLKLYDQYKVVTRKVKKAIRAINAVRTEEECDSLVAKMMEEHR